MRLSDGTLWPMPITLDVSSELADELSSGASLALLGRPLEVSSVVVFSMCLGIATDDSHVYHGKPGPRPGRGWIMVR